MKRFYETVSLEPHDGAVRLLLDGRCVKTPAKAEVIVPAGAFADALKGEWEAQDGEITPSSMPLMRLANTVIDGVIPRRNDVASDVIAYGNSDLVCYWAEAPEALVARQKEHWRPVLLWAKKYLNANFITIAGVMAIEQDQGAIYELALDINKLDDYALAALHEMTTLTGSVLISLAVVREALTAKAGWAAAHVDEVHQSEHWGEDEEAAERLKRREAAFMAAVHALELLGVINAVQETPLTH